MRLEDLLEGEEIEFSAGFTDLHTDSYSDIVSGGGFRIKESLKAISIVHSIRNSTPIGLKGDYHPFAKLAQISHPFSKIL